MSPSLEEEFEKAARNRSSDGVSRSPVGVSRSPPCSPRSDPGVPDIDAHIKKLILENKYILDSHMETSNSYKIKNNSNIKLLHQMWKGRAVFPDMGYDCIGTGSSSPDLQPINNETDKQARTETILKTTEEYMANLNATKQVESNPAQSQSQELPEKKSRPKYRPSRPPLLPPCRVCGDRASGFHYGVNTCEACKGFFRRSINKAEPCVCAASGNCQMAAGKRTACSACRFRRCIEVGMSKNAIKTGRYTHELRSKNILEVKQLEKQNNGITDSTYPNKEVTAHASQEPEEDKEEIAVFQSHSKTLIEAQKSLYEFLDDYFNDELILQRQINVHNNYSERKRKREQKLKQGPVTYSHHAPYPVSYTRHSPAMGAMIPIALDTTKPICKEDIPPNNRVPGMIPVNSIKRGIDGDRTALEEHSMQSPKKRKLDGPVQVSLDFDVTKLRHIIENDPISNNQNYVEQSAKHGKQSPDKQAYCYSKEFDELCKENIPNVKRMCNVTSNTTKASTFGLANIEHTENGAILKSIKFEDDENIADPTEETKAEVLATVITDMERGIAGMVTFAKSMPGFSDLPKEDQVLLLKSGRFDIWFVGHIRCFNSDLKVGACEWQFHADEIKQVWGHELIELAFRLSSLGKLLHLTKEETAALRAVCLSFPDRCYPLTARAKVELIHSNMLNLLKHVASRRHSNYNAWFAKVINFLCVLREFGILFEKQSANLQLEWSVLKKNPLLLEVFLS